MNLRNIFTLLTTIVAPVAFLQVTILWIQTPPLSFYPTHQALQEIGLNQSGDCQARVSVGGTDVMTYSSVQAAVDDPNAGGNVVKVFWFSANWSKGRVKLDTPMLLVQVGSPKFYRHLPYFPIAVANSDADFCEPVLTCGAVRQRCQPRDRSAYFRA